MEGKSVHLMRGGLTGGRNSVNVADRWRERACTLCAEVSQAVSSAVVTTNCEKSAEPIVARKLL